MSTFLVYPNSENRPNSGQATSVLLAWGALLRLAALNIQHLMYWPPDVAWDTITAHLLFVFHRHTAPPSIRLQAVRALDDILANAQRHLAAGPGDLQATVQRRVPDVLAQQIMLGELASTASIELRRLGLERLASIGSYPTRRLGNDTHVQLRHRPALSVPPSQSAPSSPGREHSPPLITAGKRLFGANQDRFSVHDASMRCSRRSFARAPLCIGTVGQFGQQADTNIALMRRRVSSGASRTP